MKILLPILLLLSISSHANAKGLTCGFMFEQCSQIGSSSDIKQTFSAGYCFGYLVGIVKGDNNRFFKVPAGVDGIQLVNVLNKWLKNNPEKWHEDILECVVLAFLEAGYVKPLE
tara:strand:- start:77 stop:418 length:342 start_codon:yes stop_codon:yes gene_type:complete